MEQAESEEVGIGEGCATGRTRRRSAVLHLSREVSMSDVRTMRWPKNCSRCNTEMEPGTQLVEDQSNVGPRGGALFRHANPAECRKMNPFRFSRPGTSRDASPHRRRNPVLVADLPDTPLSRRQGAILLAGWLSQR